MIAKQIYEYNIVEEITNHITNEEEGLLYFIAERTIAFPGFNNFVDKELCKSNDVKVIELPNEGGAIISSEGSISIGHFSKDFNNTFNKDLTYNIINYLKNLGLNVSLNENDILIDNIYKVASSGSRRFGNILFSTFHISNKVDLDLIKKICTKPMNKIPKGLTDYGLTANQLFNLFVKENDNLW